MDNLTPKQRSYTMSRIRSRETEPEITLRSLLHRKGIRFRKNVEKLPGAPDIVLPKYKTVIFVNGCFWHQHKGCPRNVMPKSNRQYWKSKLKKNVLKDEEQIEELVSLGWRVLTVWECEMKARSQEVVREVCDRLRKGKLSRSIGKLIGGLSK